MEPDPCQAYFSCRDERGMRVELRHAPTWWLALDDPRPVLYDQDADESDGDDWDDAAGDGLYDDGDSNDPLCSTRDEDVNPIWWVSGDDGRGAPSSLIEVLDLLAPDRRGPAVAAHLRMLGDIARHEQAAVDVSDGISCDPFCTACITEPEVHAMVLADGLTLRAKELADALGVYAIEVSVLPAGERLPE
jgi:hypothetical protein